MKKEFIVPEMKISRFHVEDVVKTSGYSNKVKDELGVSGNNLTEKSFTEIFPTF